MPEPAVKEALQLMFSPPIQVLATRVARAGRENRHDDADRWQAALEATQRALEKALVAHAQDKAT